MRRTIQDLLLAATAGTIVVVSPFVPMRPTTVIPAFLLVAGAVLFYRRRLERARSAVSADDAAETSWLDAAIADLRDTSPLVALCLVGVVLLYWPSINWMYRQWTSSVWINTHGIFVAPLAIYMAWIVLRRDKSTEREHSAWGFAFVVPATCLLVLDLTARNWYLSAAGFILLLPGLSLLFLGRRRTSALKVPLLIAAFLIPVPYIVTSVLFLREITTTGTVFFFRSVGTAIYSTGTTLELPWGPFRVSEACSGLATFYSAICIAAIFATLSRSPVRRAVLLLSAIPLALLCNMVRVTLLVLLCRVFGNDLLATPIHEASGAIAFIVVFIILERMSDRKEVRGALT
jgi:exosortase